jgi:NAD(P)-dependent dehydrogenase (short-subunit alcohol dehydrogenase family)
MDIKENLQTPQLNLSGKVALVTGASRGIGWAITQTLVHCGARVVVCDLDLAADNLQWAAEQDAYFPVLLDVTQETSCDAAVQMALQHWGKLDILVNNAGIFENLKSTHLQEVQDWQSVMDVNLRGAFLMARAASRVMRMAPLGGAIVNIASVAGMSGFRASNAYGVSKAALIMLTQTLATDLASRGIRVNAVAPGFIHSPMTDTLEQNLHVPEGTFRRRIPMGYLGQAQDVAHAVAFVASDLASYITGAVLPVDGGWQAFGGPGDASASKPAHATLS